MLQDYTIIYGGSFNPPHFGHYFAAVWMVEALNAKVHIIPVYEHTFGKELAHFDDRLDMCEELYFKASNGKWAWASSIEERMPKPNITLNLVKEHLKVTNKIAVAIGSDLVSQLDKWEGWDEVRKLAKIVVIGRAGANAEDNETNFIWSPIEMPQVSSTEVRERIKAGKPITGMVLPGVEQYIHSNGLYL